MKLAMTLLVRDELDIIEANLSFHLNAGVDVIIVTDHRSTDGTSEILESYARDGYVHLIRREDDYVQQSEWVTYMARVAASEHAADWVINSDADEFWWPRAGSLNDVLASVPAQYGVVRAVSRAFIPRPGEEWFAERMTACVTLAAPINAPDSRFRHVAKVAHRAHRDAVVQQGNHRVSGLPHPELPGWSPVEVLHFPLRSREQSARKHQFVWTSWLVNLRGDLARAKSMWESGRLERYYESISVDNAMLRRGLAAGSLVEDVRLRDALRALRDGSGGFVRPEGRRDRLQFGPVSFVEDASRSVEGVLLAEAEAVRVQRRADELAVRLARRERRPVHADALS
jgi:Glycosyl transferase family 2